MPLPDIPVPRAPSVNSTNSENLSHSSIVLSDQTGIHSDSADDDDNASEHVSDESQQFHLQLILCHLLYQSALLVILNLWEPAGPLSELWVSNIEYVFHMHQFY
jgi:hypothetical protein